MDYEFFAKKDRVDDKTTGVSKSTQEYMKQLEQAKRRKKSEAQEEAPVEKQARVEEYESYNTWNDTVLPEASLNDAPVGVYSFMQQDDEEGWGSARYLQSRLMGKIRDFKFWTPITGQSVQTFVEKHPRFTMQEGGADAVTALGESTSFIGGLRRSLEDRGLMFGSSSSPTDIIEGGWDYIKGQIGPRGLSRLPRGERSRVIGAVWAQELIRNSLLKDRTKAINYVIPKVRQEIEGEFMIPYNYDNSIFHQDMKRLHGAVEEIDGVVSETATLNEAIPDTIRNKTMRRWYTTLRGKEAPEDIKAAEMIRVLKPYIGVYDNAVNKAETAYKWHLAGVDVPLKRLHEDGTLFGLTELPGVGAAGPKLVRNAQMGVAYDNIEDHSRTYGAQKIIEGAQSVDQVLQEQFGITNPHQQLDLRKYHNFGSGKWKPGIHDHTETPQDIYYILQQIALSDPTFKEKFLNKKQEYAHQWIQRNEESIKQLSLDDGIAPEVVGNYLRDVFYQGEEMSETARKKQQAYEESYGYRYFNELIHMFGAAFQTMGTSKFGEMTRGLHEFMYAQAFDAIPQLDRELIGMQNRTFMDALRDGVSKALPVSADPEGALQDYLDDVIAGDNIPILSQLGMIMKDTVRGLIEIPFMAAEDPFTTGVMMGTLQGYNKASVGWAKKVAKKIGRPGMEPALLAIFRPHEFAANVGKATKFALTDRMLFGCSANKFRKMLNNLTPELRREYHGMLKGLVNDMTENGSDSVKNMGRAARDATDALGAMMADADYTRKLSRVDMDGVRQKALDRDISFEAANALFSTPFGRGKMVDGALQKHINTGFFDGLMKLQDDVIAGVKLEDRAKRTPAELMYNVNREYLKFKADRTEAAWNRRQRALQNRLGIRAQSTFDTIRDYYQRRYNYERSSLFDRDSISAAVEANQYQVERAAAKKRLFHGFQYALGNRLDQLNERLKSLGRMRQTKKVVTETKRLRTEAAETKRMADIAVRDVETLGNREKSLVVDRTNANEAMFQDVENGWRSNGDQAYQKAFMEHLVKASLFHKKTAELLGKVFPGAEKAIRRLSFHQRKKDKIKGRKRMESYNIRWRRMEKAILDSTTKDTKTGEITGLFEDNPPFKIGELIRGAKGSMRQLVDYAMKSKNIRGAVTAGMNRAVGDVVGAMLSTHPGIDTSARFRHIVQRVTNFAQGPAGLLDRIQDKVRLMGDEKFRRFTELTKMSTDQLKKTDYGELTQLALEMRMVRDQLIRAQRQAGLITKKEMNKALKGGTDSHFYLSKEFRNDLRHYERRDRMTLFPEETDTPRHEHLNIQRKFNTPRVSWYDRAAGEWKILDFKPKNEDDLGGAIKRAENYIESIRKKYPGMDPNDIRYINPLGEEDVALRGLIDQDANYQIDALRDMLQDLAKTHLLNEAGMIQGLVRSDLPSQVKRRGGWTKIGGNEATMTPNQRRMERMRWGSLYGKYVHASFFDQISAYDDMSSVIKNVADSFRDTVAWAESAEGRSFMGRISEWVAEATGNLDDRTIGSRLMKIGGRHLRRNLITMNPASYVNNFMGALTFSHMAGAKVMSPRFWDGYLDGDSWNNFGKLLDEVGETRFELLGTERGREMYRKRGLSDQDIDSLELFKYAADRGIIERTDEGVFTGGKRRTGRRPKLRNLVKDIDETSLKRINKARRDLRALDKTISDLDHVIASGRIPDAELYKYTERRDAFRLIRKNKKQEVGKLSIDNHLRITMTLPDKIVKAASNTATELGRFISTDPESAVHRIVSSWYGNIDPMLKWQTLRYLVQDAGMTKEGALQRVLDFHQNYGTISPSIRHLRNVPFLGSFVPSFPAEAARIMKNGLGDSVGRTFAPLMATAMWNQTALASQGMDISDLANINNGVDNPLDMLKALCTQVLMPMGGGRMATIDTMKWSPVSVFLEPEGLAKGRLDDVADQGLLGSVASIPMNFASNFALNTPLTQIIQEHVAGVDSFTGRVNTDTGVRKPLMNFLKDVTKMYVPKAISRPYEYYKRVSETPTSVITKRDVSALEGILRTAGIRLDIRGKDEQIASLVLQFMYKDERESFIKNSITMDDDMKLGAWELANMAEHSTEWAEKLDELSEEMLRRRPKELKIGTETVKLERYSASEKQKIVKRLITKASNNIFNVIEEMDPIRKLHMMRAVKHTWNKDEPAYQHALKSLTQGDFVSKLTDVGRIAEIYTDAVEMAENTVDEEFKRDMMTVARTMVARTIQLRARSGDRNAAMARALISASRGDVKRRLMEVFAKRAGLLE